MRLQQRHRYRSRQQQQQRDRRLDPSGRYCGYQQQFELFINLPGLDANSVELSLDNDVLTLSGERPVEKRAGENQLMSQRIECSHGRFHRRFVLPDTVDTERVTAKGRNGVLEVTIGKQAKAQPRRIPNAFASW